MGFDRMPGKNENLIRFKKEKKNPFGFVVLYPEKSVFFKVNNMNKSLATVVKRERQKS